MNLIIDRGNTLTKLALFKEGEMLDFKAIPQFGLDELIAFSTDKSIESTILSSVKSYPSEVDSFLKENFRTILFDHQTSLPITNRYDTPETLGKDRLAAVVGAWHKFPKENVLVIDAGTALTFDFINADGEYLGGAISPGIAMRFKALNQFTDKLPLVGLSDSAELIGRSTESSILSGVLNGIVAEVEGTIQNYQLVCPDLKIVMTGGDQYYFDKRLKIKTFAALNLVVEGLNLILDFNIGTSESYS